MSKQILIWACLALAMQSCFTGIESTPKITASELKRQRVSLSDEQLFLQGVTADRPALWQAGKEFYVTDNRISLIFTSASTGTDSLAGEIISLNRIDSVATIDRHSAAELVFLHGNDTLRYQPGIDYAGFEQRENFDVPFTVDMDLVAKVRSKMAGNHYWIRAARWYDSTGKTAVNDSRRHVPVVITDVRPGTSSMPLLVLFRQDDGSESPERAVYMTVGEGNLAVRNFDTLFSFTDPRRRYPNITDETWTLITRGELRNGMTRDECRLAIGAPLQIIHGSGTRSTIERWSYDDGIYLIFDDGLLTQYRQ